MKKNILFLAILLLTMAGCHNSNGKTTKKDVEKAEKALFNEDQTMNETAATEAIAIFNKYAEENADATDAPEMLFKAIDIAINTRQSAEQSVDMVERLVADYPAFDKNPVALFMLATFVYDEQLHDLDMARETYQRIIDNYPDSPFAADAAIAITQLGMSPEELIKMFEAQEQ